MPLTDRFVALASLGFVVLAAPGCSSSDKGDGGGGAGGGTTFAFENNGDGECSGSVRPKNDDFCSGKCSEPVKCTNTAVRPIDSCCVLVGEPGAAKNDPYLKRTTNTKEFADPTGAPPNLGCFEPAGYPTAGASGKTAKLKGEIRPFANGGCTTNALIGVTVEIFKVKRTPGEPATDGALDQQVGTTLTVSDTNETSPEDVDNCSGGPRYNRLYEFPDVPMYTELVIKTSGPGWTALYAYNIYLTEKDADYDAASGTYSYTARALAEDDFSTIPTVAIGTTIQPGNGAIGGEIHDCDNIRLQNAQVDISLPRLGLAYFNSSEDNPVPDNSAVSTGTTALYTALDIKVTGPEGSFARVAGTGLIPDGDQSKLVSLGYADVRVYPDSVTAVSLRGLRPYQVP